MRMKLQILMTFLTILSVWGCMPKQDTITVKETSNAGTGSNGGNTSNPPSSSSSSCTGTTQDGVNNGNDPLHIFNLWLAGEQTWYSLDEHKAQIIAQYGSLNNSAYTSGGSDSPATLAAQTFEDTHTFTDRMATDNRFQVRFYLGSEPVAAIGQNYCYGRQHGQSRINNYSKVKLRVSLVSVYCREVDSSNSARCNEFEYGTPYATTFVGPISVGGCSPVVDFSNKVDKIVRYESAGSGRVKWGTIIRVDDVRSDSMCQFTSGDFGCPSDVLIRRGSCWNVKMQVSTDFTHSF